MARLMGVDLPRDKRMEIALTYIYGIGRTRSQEILDATGISRDQRTKDLTDDQVSQLRDYIEGSLKVEGDLRREVQADIRRKIEIGCYQGLRHRRGLPVRGQRTKTNARTRKGPQAHHRRQEEGQVTPDGTGKEGRHRRQEGSEDPSSGKRRTSRTAPLTSRAPSTTRSSRSPIPRATSSPGVVGTRRVQGLA